MENIYKKLLKMKEVTEQIKGLLLQDDLDSMLLKLKERQKILDNLQGFFAKSDTKGRISSNSDIKVLIKSIISMDQKNIEEVNARLTGLSNSISSIGKEKQTLKQLQSGTNIRQKRIVDILY